MDAGFRVQNRDQLAERFKHFSVSSSRRFLRLYPFEEIIGDRCLPVVGNVGCGANGPHACKAGLLHFLEDKGIGIAIARVIGLELDHDALEAWVAQRPAGACDDLLLNPVDIDLDVVGKGHFEGLQGIVYGIAERRVFPFRLEGMPVVVDIVTEGIAGAIRVLSERAMQNGYTAPASPLRVMLAVIGL